MKIKTIQTGEISTWSMQQVLDEINRDHNADWIPYDESDWKEGWYEWVDGEFYSLVSD